MSEHSSKWSSSSTSHLFIQNEEETAQQLHIHILRVSVYNLPPPHPPPHSHVTTHIHTRTTVASSLLMSSSCYASMPSSFLYISIPLNYTKWEKWDTPLCLTNPLTSYQQNMYYSQNYCRTCHRQPRESLQNEYFTESLGGYYKGRGNKIEALFEGWRLVESSFICSEGFCEGIRDDDDTAEFQQDTSKQ